VRLAGLPDESGVPVVVSGCAPPKNLLHFLFALIENTARTSDVGFDLLDWLVVF
jgi:hypothetical protein